MLSRRLLQSLRRISTNWLAPTKLGKEPLTWTRVPMRRRAQEGSVRGTVVEVAGTFAQETTHCVKRVGRSKRLRGRRRRRAKAQPASSPSPVSSAAAREAAVAILSSPSIGRAVPANRLFGRVDGGRVVLLARGKRHCLRVGLKPKTVSMINDPPVFVAHAVRRGDYDMADFLREYEYQAAGLGQRQILVKVFPEVDFASRGRQEIEDMLESPEVDAWVQKRKHLAFWGGIEGSPLDNPRFAVKRDADHVRARERHESYQTWVRRGRPLPVAQSRRDAERERHPERFV